MAFYATEKVVATTLPYKINKLLLFFRFKAHSAPADKFIQTCKHIVLLTRLWCQDRSVVHDGPQVRQSNFFVQTRTWRVADGLVKGWPAWSWQIKLAKLCIHRCTHLEVDPPSRETPRPRNVSTSLWSVSFKPWQGFNWWSEISRGPATAACVALASMWWPNQPILQGSWQKSCESR